MASLREWIALTLSALLFSIVAGYGVGRALNAKNDAPPPSHAAAPTVAIVDRTGDPVDAIGSLSQAEMDLPTEVTTAVSKVEPARVIEPSSVAVSAPEPATPASPVAFPAHPPTVKATAQAVPAPPSVPTMATLATPVAPNDRASVLISFADQRLYVMAGDRQIASYRVKLGFDPVRVKPGATQVQAKNNAGKVIELGWKNFPVTAAGERGFILSPTDFDALSARIAPGASVSTTRERVAKARLIDAPQPEEPARSVEPRAQDPEQPAFLAAAPRVR